jgi:2'-5' RNA ligase
LWPDATVRASILARRDALGPISRRRVPDHNLHLTLLFLGNQPAERLDEIQSVADSISIHSFSLVLDRFGWFSRARVAWLGGEAPGAARELVARLSGAMTEIGLRFDQRPFRPHVTLFRKVDRRPDFPKIRPLRWPIENFSLIESIPGRPYHVLRTWRVG